MRTIKEIDKGTAYAAALLAYDEAGASRATDAQVMAAFCEHDLQLLMGAYGPRLVWEGAQREGMTGLNLTKLCTPRMPAERQEANRRLEELMFGYSRLKRKESDMREVFKKPEANRSDPGEVFYTIAPEDVGKSLIITTAGNIPVSEFMGRVQKIDVGKRLYRVPDEGTRAGTHAEGQKFYNWQVESEAQRDARLAKDKA